MLVIATLGVFAGLITTLSGFGGGAFLVACLALLWDPLTALTISSLALLAGNAQRLYLFRRDFQWRFSMPVVLGSIPGALGGALVAIHMPSWLLQVAILVATLAGAVKVLFKLSGTAPRSILGPGSAAVGFLSATTGGGGFLMGPLLLSTGATGGLYIATGASAGVAIHCLRITGYSTTGLIDYSLIGQAVLIAFAIMIGNVTGRVIRLRVGAAKMLWLEYGAPVVCALVASAGLML
jgi:uncharacterized membrane protein YfcA